MNLETWKPLGKLWSQWTVATTLTGALVYPLVVVGAAWAGERPVGYWFALPVAGLAAGGLAGWWQERILRPHLQVTKRWIFATGLGWALGLGAVVGFSSWFLPFAKEIQSWYALTVYLVGAGLGGALSGLGQWVLLRTKIEKSVWWFMACGVGSLTAWLVVLAAWYFLGRGADLAASTADLPVQFVLSALAGWMMGMEQGVALVGLIAQEEWERRRGKSISFF